MFSKFAARRRGFTLIELLIVIVVIAILALIVIPKLMGASRKAKDSTLKGNLQLLRAAVEHFHADTGVYPEDLNGLVADKDTEPNDANGDPVPDGTYQGPYLNLQGGIGGGALPRNPYAATDAELDDCWTYDETTGDVVPATPADLDTLDANGDAYNTY